MEMLLKGFGRRPRTRGEVCPAPAKRVRPDGREARESLLCDQPGPPFLWRATRGTEGEKTNSNILKNMNTRLEAVMEQQEKSENKPETSQSKETEESELRPWPDLPQEILKKIVSHLYLADRIRFPTVCKGWRAFTILPDHQDRPPWLVRVHKTEGLCYVLDISCDKTYWFVSPELVGASIHSSKFGWLLLSKGGSNFFFFNPLSSEKIDLPPIALDHVATVAFSAPPTCSSYMVCLIKHDLPFALTTYIYRKGNASWSSHQSSNFFYFLRESCTSVFCDGLFYCTMWGNRVGVLNPVNMQWDSLETPRPTCSYSQTFIAEFLGEVYILYIPSPDRPIQIVRLDYPRKIMEKVQTLGNRALFMSPHTVMMTKAPMKGMENKVHYPLLKAPADGEPLGYYFYLSLGISELFGESSQSSCAWFEPNADMVSNSIP